MPFHQSRYTNRSLLQNFYHKFKIGQCIIFIIHPVLVYLYERTLSENDAKNISDKFIISSTCAMHLIFRNFPLMCGVYVFENKGKYSYCHRTDIQKIYKFAFGVHCFVGYIQKMWCLRCTIKCKMESTNIAFHIEINLYSLVTSQCIFISKNLFLILYG